MYKRELKKPDGRDLTLYSTRPVPEGIQVTSPSGSAHGGEPHLRWHPLRGEWVAYATHRQNRTFLPPKEYNPLAPTRNPEFPTELPAGDYDAAVFTNLFASLTLDARSEPASVVPTRPANGHCEVVVFTPDAEASLGGLPLEKVKLVIDVWADRYRELARRPELRYVLPFENRGVEVGVTLHHPHGQIYAYPFVPPIQEKMLETQSAFHARSGRTLLSDLLTKEREDGRRILHAEASVTAFLPAFARYPYEVWIAPNRPVARLEDLDETERGDLARTLKTVLLKYDGLWQRPFPYLMLLMAAPTDGSPHPEWHFHIQFFPPYRTRDKLKFLAGTELGAGMFVNDSLPEEKALELQAVEVSLE